MAGLDEGLKEPLVVRSPSLSIENDPQFTGGAGRVVAPNKTIEDALALDQLMMKKKQKKCDCNRCKPKRAAAVTGRTEQVGCCSEQQTLLGAVPESDDVCCGSDAQKTVGAVPKVAGAPGSASAEPKGAFLTTVHRYGDWRDSMVIHIPKSLIASGGNKDTPAVAAAATATATTAHADAKGPEQAAGTTPSPSAPAAATAAGRQQINFGTIPVVKMTPETHPDLFHRKRVERAAAAAGHVATPTAAGVATPTNDDDDASSSRMGCCERRERTWFKVTKLLTFAFNVIMFYSAWHALLDSELAVHASKAQTRKQCFEHVLLIMGMLFRI